MDFFHSLPVPEFWEWDFFIPFPFPKFGNGFFYSLPVPEFREWAFSIPFPFPNFGNGLFQFPSRSRTLKSHSRSPLWIHQSHGKFSQQPCINARQPISGWSSLKNPKHSKSTLYINWKMCQSRQKTTVMQHPLLLLHKNTSPDKDLSKTGFVTVHWFPHESADVSWFVGSSKQIDTIFLILSCLEYYVLGHVQASNCVDVIYYHS